MPIKQYRNVLMLFRTQQTKNILRSCVANWNKDRPKHEHNGKLCCQCPVVPRIRIPKSGSLSDRGKSGGFWALARNLFALMLANGSQSRTPRLRLRLTGRAALFQCYRRLPFSLMRASLSLDDLIGAFGGIFALREKAGPGEPGANQGRTWPHEPQSSGFMIRSLNLLLIHSITECALPQRRFTSFSYAESVWLFGKQVYTPP
jgi:hypothetical protein